MSGKVGKMRLNLKKIYNSIPEPLKNLFGVLGRYKIIESRSFKNQYKELKKIERDEVSNQKAQMELLRGTLAHAYEHVPFYHRLFDEIGFDVNKFNNIEEMKIIPYLTKDIIREHWSELQADDIQNFYYSTSGGTTGKPIQFSFDNESLYRERAFVYYYWSKFGYDYKKSKLISFRDVEFGDNLVKQNKLYNELLINPFKLDSIHLQDILREIYKFSGEFLYGYPSNIAIFCRLLKKQNIDFKLPIKAIFLISENMYPDQKKQIEEVFSCPIAMFYGHTEKSVFAEKYGETYRFNPIYGYTEILEDTEDNIVCTGFINAKMPLIRYKVDDRAIAAESGYKILGHRSNEVLYGKNDYTISSTTLEFGHEECFDKIDSYQFEQKEIGKVIMKIESDQFLSEQEYIAIRKKVEEKLPGFEISIIKTDKITRTKRGKYKLIIQHLSNGVEILNNSKVD